MERNQAMAKGITVNALISWSIWRCVLLKRSPQLVLWTVVSITCSELHVLLKWWASFCALAVVNNNSSRMITKQNYVSITLSTINLLLHGMHEKCNIQNSSLFTSLQCWVSLFGFAEAYFVFSKTLQSTEWMQHWFSKQLKCLFLLISVSLCMLVVISLFYLFFFSFARIDPQTSCGHIL